MDWDSYQVEKVANGYVAFPRTAMGNVLEWSKLYHAPTISALGTLIDSVAQQTGTVSKSAAREIDDKSMLSPKRW